MFLDLNEEQKLIRETARQFALAELAPLAAALDRGDRQELFLDNLKKLAELGFMGLKSPVPALRPRSPSRSTTWSVR